MSPHESSAPDAGASPVAVPAGRGGTILIAAGGTGGHIMPARAVAQALRARWPEFQVEFVCGMRPVELRAYWDGQEQPRILPCGKPVKGGVRRALGPMLRWVELGLAVPKAARLIDELKPKLVLGMGGYITAPVLTAALRRRIPVLLHESNAVCGRTTRLFSRWSSLVLLTHEAAARQLHPRADHELVGTPVRPDLFGVEREAAAKTFELDASRQTLLVFGGSQGARALNGAIQDLIAALDARGSRVQVLWSTGAGNFAPLDQWVKSRPAHASVIVQVRPSIKEMGDAYSLADLVISRSGAASLAEIAAFELPSLLVPLPTARDDHQRANAVSAAAGGSAIVVEEGAGFSARLSETAIELLSHPDRLLKMTASARGLAARDSADRVAALLAAIATTGSIPPRRPSTRTPNFRTNPSPESV